MKKSRFLYLDPKVNPGKIASLEALQASYAAYLEVCVGAMLSAHKFSLALKDKQAFFPVCPELSSQIVKNVRDHAISIVSGWAASKYTTKLKSFIKGKFRDGEIDEAIRSSLYILGKRLVDKPSGKVTQEALDLYWSWLLDEEVVGKTPGVSARCGMSFDELVRHFVKGEKKAAITELAYCTKASIEALTIEMSKCEVRCANCHLKRTWDDRGYKEPGGRARKRSRKPLPQDRVEALRRRRAQGLSYEQLGWEFGVSPGTAWRMVNQPDGNEDGKQDAVQEDGSSPD